MARFPSLIRLYASRICNCSSVRQEGIEQYSISRNLSMLNIRHGKEYELTVHVMVKRNASNVFYTILSCTTNYLNIFYLAGVGEGGGRWGRGTRASDGVSGDGWRRRHMKLDQ